MEWRGYTSITRGCKKPLCKLVLLIRLMTRSLIVEGVIKWNCDCLQEDGRSSDCVSLHNL